jgi:hypothetical protein
VATKGRSTDDHQGFVRSEIRFNGLPEAKCFIKSNPVLQVPAVLKEVLQIVVIFDGADVALGEPSVAAQHAIVLSAPASQ